MSSFRTLCKKLLTSPQISRFDPSHSTTLVIVRDEGKISRKLIELLNTYLLKDGPNLGCQSLEIHDAVRQFLFRCWITTHDRGLKDALILYARLQLNLTRGAADGSTLVEQLLDVVGKDLDQNNICSSSIPWSDTTKDDKCGNLTSSQCGLVELAALVFYRILARWNPVGACRPVIDEAPVFYPTIEEVMIRKTKQPELMTSQH